MESGLAAAAASATGAEGLMLSAFAGADCAAATSADLAESLASVVSGAWASVPHTCWAWAAISSSDGGAGGFCFLLEALVFFTTASRLYQLGTNRVAHTTT